MPLEAYADLEIFLFRLLGGGEHLAHARGIGGHGLFHEDVFAGLDRGLKHHRAKAGRRGQDGDIGGRDRLFKTIEAEELALRRDIDAGGVPGFQIAERALQPVFVDVGHGHEFDRAEVGSVERLIRRAATASAAADESDLEFVCARRMGETLGGQRAEERAADHGGGAFFEESPPAESVGREVVGRMIHNVTGCGGGTAR